MKIAIGCDHMGLELKRDLMQYLDELQVDHHDFGTHDQHRTDYPLFAVEVARAILDDGFDLGILICGTGIGMSIAANKIPGIRAAACSEPYSARLARNHNNANVLGLGAQVVGKGLARSIVKEWLSAGYDGGRHQKRIDMIHALEANMNP